MPNRVGIPESIGHMRKRAQLQTYATWTPPVPGQATTAVNDFNEQVVLDTSRPTPDGWTTIAVIWAEVMPLTGRELFYMHQIRPDITSKVRIRYWKNLPRLSPKMRFVIEQGLRKLNIEYVLPSQEKRWQECLCREEVI